MDRPTTPVTGQGPVIRILVVDDHPLVRTALRVAFDGVPGMTVVATAQDGVEALDTVGTAAPDVVVMDVSMPGLDGLEAARRILAGTPAVRIVVLTSIAAPAGRQQAAAAGARAYVGKEEPLDALVDAVRAAAGGRDLLQTDREPVDERSVSAHLPSPT